MRKRALKQPISNQLNRLAASSDSYLTLVHANAFFPMLQSTVKWGSYRDRAVIPKKGFR